MRVIAVCGPVVWLMLTAQAAVPSPAVFDPISEVRSDFETIANLASGPAPKLIIITDADGDGSVFNGRVTLSTRSIGAAHSREELKGLLAYLIAQAVARPASVDADTMPTITSMLAAGAVIAAGEKIDPLDWRNAPLEARRNYEWSPKSTDKAGGTDRGRMALAMMQRVQTCSGAALALMKRLAFPKDAVNGPPIRFIGQQAVRDFGSLAAPPDMSCIGEK